MVLLIAGSLLLPPMVQSTVERYTAEAPMPADSPIHQISIVYPPADGGIGWDIEIAWMVTFFLLTIVFALALKKPMGVEF